MDEIFHVPQAQRYCRGHFGHWDDKITTFPGLYLATATPAWLAGLAASSLDAVALDTAADWLCSAAHLRLANALLFGGLTTWLSFRILSELHGREAGPLRIALATAALNLFPVHFFSVDLFYTDAGALAMVLLSFFLCLRARHHASAAAAAAAVLFRQTNVVWACFILAFDIHRQLNPPDRESKKQERGAGVGAEEEEEPLVRALWAVLGKAWLHRGRLVRHHWTMLALVGGFVAFVRWNGGVVVGDRESHQAVPHLAQFLYCVGAMAAAAAPTHFHPRTLLGRGKALLRGSRWAKLRAALLLAAVALVIKRFTYVHLYTLSDNRHYTFYVWRKVLGRSEATRLALAPLYAYSLWCVLASLQRGGHCPPLVRLAFVTCAAATVVLSELLEFRYFIAPLAVHALLAGPPPWLPSLVLQVAGFAAVNALVEWRFLCRPIGRWSDGSVARIMW